MSVGEEEKVISGNGTRRLVLSSCLLVFTEVLESEADCTSELGVCPAKHEASHVKSSQKSSYASKFAYSTTATPHAREV